MQKGKDVVVSPCKFQEEEIIGEILEYIRGTYREHYSGNGPECRQLVEEIAEAGDFTSWSRWTIIKYLWRFGKKNGFNIRDLQKSVHYILLMIYFHRKYNPESY